MTWRHWFNIKAKPCLKRCRVPFMSTLCLSTNHCQCSLCCILTAAFHKQPNTADLSTDGMKRMVTSKYRSVNVLVSRPTFCVLLKKYMLLTHDRVCLVTADKCKTLLEVSYFDSVLYFCFNSFPVYAICLEIETNVSTDRAILNILRHHIENDVFTTYVCPTPPS